MNLHRMHLDFRVSTEDSDGVIFQSDLIPGIVGINIGCDRWRDIIVKRDDIQIGRLKTDSCGIRVYGKNGVFLKKIINWPALGFKTLLENLD